MFSDSFLTFNVILWKSRADFATSIVDLAILSVNLAMLSVWLKPNTHTHIYNIPTPTHPNTHTHTPQHTHTTPLTLIGICRALHIFYTKALCREFDFPDLDSAGMTFWSTGHKSTRAQEHSKQVVQSTVLQEPRSSGTVLYLNTFVPDIRYAPPMQNGEAEARILHSLLVQNSWRHIVRCALKGHAHNPRGLDASSKGQHTSEESACPP